MLAHDRGFKSLPLRQTLTSIVSTFLVTKLSSSSLPKMFTKRAFLSRSLDTLINCSRLSPTFLAFSAEPNLMPLSRPPLICFPSGGTCSTVKLPGKERRPEASTARGRNQTTSFAFTRSARLRRLSKCNAWSFVLQEGAHDRFAPASSLLAILKKIIAVRNLRLASPHEPLARKRESAE